jgi:hypothetical protein
VNLYLGVLKAEMPVPAPSYTDTATCSQCGGEMWCDPESVALARFLSDGGHFVFVCAGCFEQQQP